MTTHKLLLDEHMKPLSGLPLDLFGFEITSLRDFDRSFVSTATPDWVLYLAAAARGYTGLITHDVSQLAQENEVRALQITGIAVITYRRGVGDELTKWGLLMAYAPRILQALDNGQRGALVLPTPGVLDPSSPAKLLSDIEKREHTGSTELRHRADKAMKSELSQRKLASLWPVKERG